MKRTFLTVVAVLFALSVSAQAALITIPNAGFEDRLTFDADFTPNIPPKQNSFDKYLKWAQESWRHFEVDNNGGPVRIWNPGDPSNPDDVHPQGVLDVAFGGNAPEGDIVALVRSRYNDNEFHDPPQVRDFEALAQILETTFDTTLTYTLTAKVGKLPETDEGGSINYNPDWHGYALQLAVGGTNVGGAQYAGRVDGGTVIATDASTTTDIITGDPASVPVDGFVTATLVYEPDPANDYLAGQPLQIRLLALECNAFNHALTGWVVFDDVQLTAVPEPMTLALLGLGGLGVIRRKRK